LVGVRGGGVTGVRPTGRGVPLVTGGVDPVVRPGERDDAMAPRLRPRRAVRPPLDGGSGGGVGIAAGLATVSSSDDARTDPLPADDVR
jgi:hypothetical protein